MGVNILLDTKGNSFCEMCFVFLKKNWVCGESQTILLRVHIDPDISSQNQTSNKNFWITPDELKECMSNQRKKPNELESKHFQNNKRIFKRVKNKRWINAYKTFPWTCIMACITKKDPIPHVHQQDKTCFYVGECPMFQKYQWWANQMAPSEIIK